MLFSSISPFIRWARDMYVDNIDRYEIKYCAYDHRLLYIISGEGYIDLGGVIYNLEPGDLLIHSSGLSYQIIHTTERLHFLCFNFDYFSNYTDITHPIPRAPSNMFDSDNRLELVDFEDATQFNQPFYLKNMNKHYSTLKQISEEWILKRQFFQNEVNARFLIFLNHLARNYYSSASGTVNKITEEHKNILKYVSTHYHEPLTNKALGEKFHYHPYYISRIILKQTGVPLHQYLLNLRIEQAKHLLLNTNRSITQISASVGFENNSYFSRYFKKCTGYSPKELRHTQQI